jgi:MFS family permease
MFFSAVGQTFMVAQYLPHIQTSLNISATKISYLYSLATFLASFSLSYLGYLLDRVPLRYFAYIAALLLASSQVILGLTNNLIVLFIGFVILRAFGQMTPSLISTTIIARTFGKHRGKALSIIGPGRSIGEGVLPGVVISLILYLGWRGAYFTMAALTFITLIISIFLLHRHIPKSSLYQEREVADNSLRQSYSFKTIMTVPRILGVMFTNAILPFILTGLFFHQERLLEFKEWQVGIIATSFIAYSLSNILGIFLWGALIDKKSSLYLQKFSLIPLFLALLVLYQMSGSGTSYLYFALLGLGTSFSSMIRNSFWAEVHGTESLGQIKGVDSMFLVIGTSLSPVVFSTLFDFGIEFHQLLFWLILLSIWGVITHITLGFLYQRKLMVKPVGQL